MHKQSKQCFVVRELKRDYSTNYATNKDYVFTEFDKAMAYVQTVVAEYTTAGYEIGPGLCEGGIVSLSLTRISEVKYVYLETAQLL